MELGGVAFAGRQPVKAVYLWTHEEEAVEAELLDPGEPYVWSRWRAELDLPPGRHSVSICCVDGMGRYSEPQDTSTYPPIGYGGFHVLDLEVV